MTNDERQTTIYRGSARSTPAFAINAALEECAELLARYGGHKAAAGLTIEERRLPAFARRMNEIANLSLTPDSLLPTLKVDALAQFSELSRENVEALNNLKPFGTGNPEPIFVSLSAEVLACTIVPARPPSREGAGGGTNHLRLTLRQGNVTLDGIGFNLGHLSSVVGRLSSDKRQMTNDRRQMTDDNRVNLAYTPEINEWAGQRRVRLKLKALQAGGRR